MIILAVLLLLLMMMTRELPGGLRLLGAPGSSQAKV